MQFAIKTAKCNNLSLQNKIKTPKWSLTLSKTIKMFQIIITELTFVIILLSTSMALRGALPEFQPSTAFAYNKSV